MVTGRTLFSRNVKNNLIRTKSTRTNETNNNNLNMSGLNTVPDDTFFGFNIIEIVSEIFNIQNALLFIDNSNNSIMISGSLMLEWIMDRTQLSPPNSLALCNILLSRGLISQDNETNKDLTENNDIHSFQDSLNYYYKLNHEKNSNNRNNNNNIIVHDFPDESVSSEEGDIEAENSISHSHQILNVGGQFFNVPIEVLNRHPNSFFSTLLSTGSQNGIFFIDRNFKIFKEVILTYLLQSKINIPNSQKMIWKIRQEAKFYKLQEIIDKCNEGLINYLIVQ